MKKTNLILMVISLVLLVSCGDMFTKKDKGNKRNQFLTCSPDTDALSKIFTKNVRSELVCLGESLNLFADVVRSDRPGSLSYPELRQYLIKNIDDLDLSMLDLLKAIFDLNSLLTGDDHNYISKHNINRLIDSFILINKAIVENNVYDYFTSDDKVSYAEHLRRKAKIYFAFTQVESALFKIFEGNLNTLDVRELLSRFEKLTDGPFIQKSYKVLFLKRIFLGGEEEILRSGELKRMITMLADTAKVIYDIVYLPKVDHDENEEEAIIESLKSDFDTIVRNLFIKASSETAFTMNQVVDVINAFFPELIHYTKYRKTLLKVKSIFLGSNSETFSGAEVYVLLSDIILNNLKRSLFFYRAYTVNEHILESRERITANLPKVPTTNKQEKEFEQDFNRIIRDYTHFKGRKSLAHYENGIYRSALGVAEIGLVEDLVARLFKAYTPKDNNAYLGYKVSLKDMERILVDLSEFIRGEGFQLDPQNGKFNAREANTAETITLMTSLFQRQSTGIPDTDQLDPKLIEVNHMTEFVISLLTAHSLSNKAYNYFKLQCSLDSKNRFDPSCFRQNFVSFLNDEIGDNEVIRDYLPKLVDSFESLTQPEVSDFLAQVEVFSRNCTYFDNAKTEAVPMGKGDLFMIFAAIINMEQTFNRFDRGSGDQYNNNILDPEEVERAYDEVYEGAVKALIPGRFLKNFGKSFYFYLVRYNTLPDVQGISSFNDLWRALKEGFHFVGFLFRPKSKKQAPATRYTLAMVLRTIAEQSESNIRNPYPCETLR